MFADNRAEFSETLLSSSLTNTVEGAPSSFAMDAPRTVDVSDLDPDDDDDDDDDSDDDDGGYDDITSVEGELDARDEGASL